MSQLFFLRLKIFRVVGIGFGANRYLLDHLHAVTFQPHHFLRIIR